MALVCSVCNSSRPILGHCEIGQNGVGVRIRRDMSAADSMIVHNRNLSSAFFARMFVNLVLTKLFIGDNFAHASLELGQH